jgi:hypothetical protein
VNRETRPTTRSVAKWADALAADPALLAQCREIAERLVGEDLALWGTPGSELRKTLAEIAPAGPARAAPASRATRSSGGCWSRSGATSTERVRPPGARGADGLRRAASLAGC